jgi:hypothetical protein
MPKKSVKPSPDDIQKLRWKMGDTWHQVLKYMACGVTKDGYTRQTNKEKGYWKYIPESDSRAYEAILIAIDYLKTKEKKDKRDLKFIDCGCGIGNILTIARYAQIGKIAGIEYDEKTYNIVKWLPKIWKSWSGCSVKVWRGDILKYENYGQYDIIYYYCPISKGDLQRKFEQRVADRAKKGAVIIGFYSNTTFGRDRRFKRIASYPIFVKIRSDVRNDDIIRQGDKVKLARKSKTLKHFKCQLNSKLVGRVFKVDNIGTHNGQKYLNLLDSKDNWFGGTFHIDDFNKIKRGKK